MDEERVRSLVRSEVFRMIRFPFRYIAKFWRWAGQTYPRGRWALPFALIASAYPGRHLLSPTVSFLSAGMTFFHREMNFDNVLAQTMDSVPSYMFSTTIAFADSLSPGAATIQIPFFALRSQRVYVRYSVQHQPADIPTTLVFRVAPLTPGSEPLSGADTVRQDSDPHPDCAVVDLEKVSRGSQTRLWTLIVQRPQDPRKVHIASVYGFVIIQVVGPPRELMGHVDTIPARPRETSCAA